MTGLYLVLFIVGLVFLGLSLFGADTGHDGIEIGHIDLGHDGLGHDGVDHHGADSPKLFSIRALAAFFLGFGMTGLACKWAGVGIGAQLAFSLLSGFVVAALAYFIMKVMFSQQAGAPLDSTTFVGKTGLVTIGTGLQGIGEVCVDHKYFACKEKSGGELSLNETVKVETATAGLLLVEKI
jgi:membrane protein implicated in regulation of membrane protease activity